MSTLERAGGNHDTAFERVEYENRFWLTAAGMHDLERLGEISRSRDVFLIC